MEFADTAAPRPALRVLLVEDCEDDALLIAQELRRAGYRVASRRVDTAAALRAALREPWDLVTCDWKMPGFGGAEALAILGAAALDAQVILVSGEIGEEFAVSAMRAGAHDFVSKNRLSGLAAAVERGLREAGERRARRQAEQALRVVQDRFQAITESSLDPVSVLDAAGHYLYASPALATLIGCPTAELLGSNALDAVHPEDRDSLRRELLEGVARSRTSLTVEFRVRHRDGTWRHVEAVAHNRLGDPAVRGIVITGRDVTARRNMEETIRLQSAMIDNLPEGVVLSRPSEATIIHANPKCEQLFGYGAGELVGRHMSVLGAPGSDGQVDDIVGRLRDRGEWEGEVHSRRKDGTSFWSRARISRFRHPTHGEVWVTTLADITAQKDMANALIRERSFLRTLLDAIPDVVFVKDPRGVYVECNVAAETNVQRARPEIIGHTDADLFPPDVAALNRQGDLAAIAAGRPTPVRNFLTVRGRQRIFDTIKTPIHTAGGELLGVLGVGRDITAMHETEEALKQRVALQEQLEQIATAVPGVIASIHRRADGSSSVPYASAAIRDLFGLDPADVRDDLAPVLARVHRDDLRRVAAGALDSARAMTPWREDFRVVHPARGTIWVEGIALPGADGTGGVLWHGFFSDVTERRRAEEQAQRWLHLFQQAETALAHSDAITNTIVEVNRAFAAQHGYRPEEIAGRPILELFPPEERDRWQQLLQRIDATGHGVAETVHRRRDGTLFPVLIEVTAIRDGSGRVVSRVAHTLDLSERKRHEEEQRRHAEHYRAITSAAFDGFWRLAPEARLLDVNEAYCRMSGYSREELLRMTVADVEALESLEAVQQHMADMRRDGRTRFETRHRRRDGSIFDVEVSALVLEESEERLAFLRDVTARKESERRLRESAERLRTTMDSMLEGLQIIDADWRYVYVNPAAARHSRRSPDELLGRIMPQVFPSLPETAIFAAMQRCMTAREPQSLESEFEFPDGRRSWFEISIVPVPEGIAILSVDTTGRRRAEAQLRELNADLERRVDRRTAQLAAANQELEAFSYSVSHDLRAPLRAIDGFSRAVLEDHGRALPEEGRRFLEHVRAGARRMNELIEHLLQLSRLGRQPLARQAVDCRSLVDDVVAELVQHRAGARGRVRVGDLPPCEADPTLLRQVWVNLVDNAVKYSARRAAPAIEIGSERRDGEVAYFVRDNGAGFDMAQAHRLFGVFQRLHPADEFEGTGVGLAIVQRIVHRHGGRVWADAAPDQGATFFFTIGSADEPSHAAEPPTSR